MATRKKRGRTPRPSTLSRMIFSRLLPGDAAALEGLSREYHLSQAEVIRMIIRDALLHQWTPTEAMERIRIAEAETDAAAEWEETRRAGLDRQGRP